jgi:hypothetical protein
VESECIEIGYSHSPKASSASTVQCGARVSTKYHSIYDFLELELIQIPREAVSSTRDIVEPHQQTLEIPVDTVDTVDLL